MSFKLYLEFLSIFSTFLLLIYLLVQSNVEFKPFKDLVAWLVGSILKFFGRVARQGNYLIFLSNQRLYQFEITFDSTGWKALLLIAALGLSTSIFKLKERFKFLLVAIPLIFLINLIRIVSTILIATSYGTKAFLEWHELLWSNFFILSIFLVWIGWIFFKIFGIKKFICSKEYLIKHVRRKFGRKV